MPVFMMRYNKGASRKKFSVESETYKNLDILSSPEHHSGEHNHLHCDSAGDCVQCLNCLFKADQTLITIRCPYLALCWQKLRLQLSLLLQHLLLFIILFFKLDLYLLQLHKHTCKHSIKIYLKIKTLSCVYIRDNDIVGHHGVVSVSQSLKAR